MPSNSGICQRATSATCLNPVCGWGEVYNSDYQHGYNGCQPVFKIWHRARSEGETQVFCLEWPTCNLNYACQATSDLSNSRM